MTLPEINVLSLFHRRRVERRFRRARAEAGGSIVEVALLFPVLMLIFFGMIDLGRWVFLTMEVTNAAHAGAQFGSLSLTNAYNTAGIQAAAQADVPDISVTATSSTTSCWCPSAPGTVVTCCVYPSSPCTNGSQIVLLKVNTQATYNPWIPYPPFTAAITIRGQAEIPTGQY